MVSVPAATLVTKPAALTVAIEVLLEDQLPPDVLSASEVVEPGQIADTPVIAAGAAGAATTVKLIVELLDVLP